VKGINPKAREIAKDLARRSGMTLGEWLNHAIINGVDIEAATRAEERAPSANPQYYNENYAQPSYRASPMDSMVAPHEVAKISAALDGLAARMEAAEGRSGAAINHIDRSVKSTLARLEMVEQSQSSLSSRLGGALEVIRDEQERTAARLSRSDRENASRIDALKAIETALMRIKPVDADAVADAAAAKFASRLEEAEARTRQAMDSLEASLVGLGRRLDEAEDRAALASDRATATLDMAESQLEQLAGELATRVEQARAEMAEQLRDAIRSGRLEQLEETLNGLVEQVKVSEQSSAQAIDSMGREVMKIADSMGQRMVAVENNQNQLGGELARTADALEKRVARADFAHTEALQRLSSEITKVAERLSERIGRTETRSAEIAEEAGRLTRRQSEQATAEIEALSTDFAARIRQSEERTAKLLDELQARSGGRAAPAEAPAQPVAAEPAAPAPSAEPSPFVEPTTLDEDLFVGHEPADAPPSADEDLFTPAPALPTPNRRFAALESRVSATFRTEAPSTAEHAAHPEHQDPEPAHAADNPFLSGSGLGNPFEDDLDLGPAGSAFDNPFAELEKQMEAAGETISGPFGAAGPTADLDEHHDIDHGALDQHHEGPPAAAFPEGQDPFAEIEEEPAPPFGRVMPQEAEADLSPSDMPPPKISTRDLLAQARDAARNNNTRSGAPLGRSKKGKASEDRGLPLLDDAPTRRTREGGGLLGALGFGKRKAPDGGVTTLTIMLATAVAVTATASAVGYMMLNDSGKPAPLASPEMAGVAPSAAPSSAINATAPSSAGGDSLAVATSVDPAASGGPTGGKAGLEQARQVYENAMRELDIGDANGVANLTQAANLGYPLAQYHLSAMYNTGAAGLAKDPVKARQWAERAASAGVPDAMYNLGLYLFKGTGGATDQTQAAEWFRRAAMAGLPNAQFNLANLYENGAGVPQNLTQAYLWYQIAARSGDRDAKAQADRLRPTLSNENRQAADREAGKFMPQSNGMSAAASTLASTQAH
jgi:localization factor PodJL